MDDEMLDYAAVAALTGLKLGTLYSMVSKRQIPHVRITSRLVRFPRQALEAWIKERLVLPADEPDGPRSAPPRSASSRSAPKSLAEAKAIMERALRGELLPPLRKTGSNAFLAPRPGRSFRQK